MSVAAAMAMAVNRRRLAPVLVWALLAGAAAAGCGAGSGPCQVVSGHICTVAGTGTPGDGADGLAALATNLYLPQDVSVSPDGHPFIVDWNNHHIRELMPDGTLRIVAGVGELSLSSDDPSSDRLNHPTGVAFDPGDGHLVIAAWHNSRIEAVYDLSSGTTADVYGNGMRGFAGDGGPASAATLNLPVAVVFDGAGDLIMSDQANQRLRIVDHVTGIIQTFAGTGACPDGTVCPLGDGGPALAASFNFPGGQAAQPGGRIDIDGQGNIFVADTANFRLRKIDAGGTVTTVAGTGDSGFAGDGGLATAAQLSALADVAAAPDGSLYIADSLNDCVRVVGPDGTITTAAGVCGQSGFSGDGGPAAAATLNQPYGVGLDAAGDLYVADTHNQRIRVVYR